MPHLRHRVGIAPVFNKLGRHSTATYIKAIAKEALATDSTLLLLGLGAD